MPVSQIGYLYLIESWGQKLGKIGHGARPGERRSQLQTGNPEPLVLMAAIPALYDAESALHEVLVEYRVRLEWYRDLHILRHVFCFLDQEISDRFFERAPSIPIGPEFIHEYIPRIIREDIANWKTYGHAPTVDVEPEHLLLNEGVEYALDDYWRDDAAA